MVGYWDLQILEFRHPCYTFSCKFGAENIGLGVVCEQECGLNAANVEIDEEGCSR